MPSTSSPAPVLLDGVTAVFSSSTARTSSPVLLDGVWLPPGETHLVEMMSEGSKHHARLPDGRPTYQRHKYLAALAFVPQDQRGIFVDIGAHVGLWSMQAERDFGHIIAFEPHPVHAALYPENMTRECFDLHRVALGAAAGTCGIETAPSSSGDSHVVDGGDIPMRTLDSYGIDRIDLMKIDTEGYERPILEGAEATLRRCRPVVVVEQKGKEADYFGWQRGDAVRLLEDMGMRALRAPISGDWFMGWR